jgi:hypothetical protein
MPLTVGPPRVCLYLPDAYYSLAQLDVTDGLAMAAAFYTSPAIGATTTIAVFAHEVGFADSGIDD